MQQKKRCKDESFHHLHASNADISIKTKKPPAWLGLTEKGVITLLRSKMKNKKVIVGYEISI